MKYVNGDVYTGQWHSNCREGTGELMYHNGGKYNGEFRHNKPEGKGKLEQADGFTYEGAILCSFVSQLTQVGQVNGSRANLKEKEAQFGPMATDFQENGRKGNHMGLGASLEHQIQ